MTYKEFQKIMINMLTDKQKQTLIGIGKSGAIKAGEDDKYQMGLFQAVDTLSKIEQSAGLTKSNWYSILDPNKE